MEVDGGIIFSVFSSVIIKESSITSFSFFFFFLNQESLDSLNGAVVNEPD